MAEKRFRVLFMFFSESYFATAPFSRKRSEPSTASTLPASGCGERLVPHFDHLELRGPAFGLKAVALGSHGALLGAPLCGLGHIRVGHIRKGGCACGFGPACGVPHQQGQLALLVWNTAGRPEPAGAPAFADVTDPDMAKAAQWCTEQGTMAAKGDRFEPEGWTPKFKVIEVWNKTFPAA